MSNYSSNALNLKMKNSSWTKIFDFVPEKSVVLDVGCSSGGLGNELTKRKHCKVYGTEIDKGDYQKAKQVLEGVFLVNLETEDVPKQLAAKKYDAIIFADVLEHLVDPVATLKKVKPLLSDNGKIVFSIPNMAHISVRLQLLTGTFSYGETGLLDKTHLHFYDHDQVQKIFTGAGYSIEQFDFNALTYPKSFLEDKLAKLNLKDAGFIARILDEPEAKTFQFVGVAVKTADDSKPKHAELNTTTPDHELVEYINGMKKQVKQIASKEREMNSVIEGYRSELEAIKSSKSWKLAKKISKARNLYRRPSVKNQ